MFPGNSGNASRLIFILAGIATAGAVLVDNILGAMPLKPRHRVATASAEGRRIEGWVMGVCIFPSRLEGLRHRELSQRR